MGECDLFASCSDYCGGCGQYNGIISQTAKQMKEFSDLYGFEFRSQGVFDFRQFVKALEWFVENAECPGCKQGGGFPSCAVRNAVLTKDCAFALNAKSFRVPRLRLLLTLTRCAGLRGSKKQGLKDGLLSRSRKPRKAMKYTCKNECL